MLDTLTITGVFIQIYILLYIMLCCLIAIKQPFIVGTPQAHDESMRASGFLSNMLICFGMLYFYLMDSIVSNYPTLANYLLLGITIHHGARALYSLRSYENDMYTPSMFAVVVNMVLYISSMFLVSAVLS